MNLVGVSNIGPIFEIHVSASRALGPGNRGSQHLLFGHLHGKMSMILIFVTDLVRKSGLTKGLFVDVCKRAHLVDR